MSTVYVQPNIYFENFSKRSLGGARAEASQILEATMGMG